MAAKVLFNHTQKGEGRWLSRAATATRSRVEDRAKHARHQANANEKVLDALNGYRTYVFGTDGTNVKESPMSGRPSVVGKNRREARADEMAMENALFSAMVMREPVRGLQQDA